MICPNCGNKMSFFGITERGNRKYYCGECHKIEFKNGRRKK
jgi:ribosomal protein S27AE